MAKTYGERWEILRPLKEGGQAHTYLVRDLRGTNEKFVLKRLKNTKRVNRFKTEIDAISDLQHPNIIQMVDNNLNAEKPYLVIDYYERGELSYEDVNSLSIDEKLKLFTTICDAIGFAHERGIIHRDIKPANILLDTDGITPIITDFGICFNTNEGLERLTETIEQAGARYYMAPELADGRSSDVSSRCDVYSLGKLLYWMFKGRVFDRETTNATPKYLLPEWDISSGFNSKNQVNFIYDIFNQTIVENPEERLEDGKHLSKDINKTINIFRNDGRYLDLKTPPNCVFCSVGKYSKHKLLPKITKNNATGYGQAGTQTYEVDYKHSGLEIFSGNVFNLPEGNIGQKTYKQYLILTCDNCGNCQVFKIGAEGSQNWRI